MLDKPQAIALIRHIQRMLNAAKTGHISDTDAQQLCEFWPLAGESLVRARWLDDVKAVGVRVQHNPPVEHDRLMDVLFSQQ